ncbi:MAG: hypothetical protein KDD34_09515 [Bdellovibrionales bacterium]|nr:hypothetical protein [Bdellovibrionales bacterium]
MTKQLIIATLATLAFSASSVLAQQAAPQVSTTIQMSQAAAATVNAGSAAALRAGSLLNQAEVDALGSRGKSNSRVLRTVNKLQQNIVALEKMSSSAKVGEADQRSLLELNGKLIQAIATVDADDLNNLLEILNGEVGRVIDAVSGNANGLEKQDIIKKLSAVADNVSDLDGKLKDIFNVTVEQMKKACGAKSAS